MSQPPTGDRPAGFPEPSPRPPGPPGGHPGPQGWGQHPLPPPGPWTPPGPPPTYPAQTPYGAPQHPGWDPATRYGPPPAPGGSSNTLLYWLGGAAVLLLAGLGTLVAVLLTRDDGGRPTALQATGTTAAAEAPVSTSSRPPRATGAELPGGARDAEPAPEPADSGRYAGSGETALAWVEAMARGDWQTAYDLSCADVRDAASRAAAGGDPAYALGEYFFTVTLGGHGFTRGTFDTLEYQAGSDTDLASFTLDLDNGESFLLLVYVSADGTVCDFY